MNKPQFYVINEKKDYAEILIYGVIGSSFWDDESVSAKSFLKDFKAAAEKFKNIKLRINSPGGSVWDGIPIFNEIRSAVRNGINVEVIVDGIAYSMGFYLMLAGSSAKGYRNIAGMAHSPVGGVIGNKNDFKDGARQLEIFEEGLAEIMSERMSITSDEALKQYMDGRDHFLSAKEMKDLGLLDEIIDEDSKAKVPKDAQNMKMSELFNFYETKNLFPSAIDRIKERVIDMIALSTQEELTNQNSNTNMLKTICALLALSLTATEDEVINGIRDLKEKQRKSDEDLAAEKKLREAADTLVTDLQGQVTAKDTEIQTLKDELAKRPAAKPSVVNGGDASLNTEEDFATDPINSIAKSYVTK